MDLLSQLSFGAPWLLTGLLALPVIWLLLRVTPPAPRPQIFPPLRLLTGLVNEEETPAKTPWWLLLLRLVAAALLILALADPILGRGLVPPTPGPLVLVVDNGWTAADGWSERARAITDLLHGAGDRPVVLLPTASTPPTNLLNAGEAERLARGLQPMPWPGDRITTMAALARWKLKAPSIIWLSDGIEDGNANKFLAALKARGPVTLLMPQRGALGLLPPARDGSGFTVVAIRPAGGRAADVEAAALGTGGETLSAASLHFRTGSGRAEGHLTLPLEVRNRVQRLALRGQDSAGAVQLLDTGNVRRRAGIVAISGGEQSLLADSYYLDKALSPYAETSKGTVTNLLSQHVSVLVLADVGRIAGDDEPKIADFVKNGGILIRFAGEHVAQGADALVPVPLRVGERYLNGAMAWGQPQHLGAFGPDSPFNGLGIAEDVTVSRQVLAEPSAELNGHVWARLSDGTPLVTARRQGQGWIILFHTAASPGWSTLPLSGLYVDMLRRLLALAGGAPAESLAGLTTLPPVSVLDGFGHQGAPGGEVMPIAAKDFVKTEVSHLHPPGLYGAQGIESALNTLKSNDALLPLPALNVERRAYGSIDAKALEPYLLLGGALLLLLDTLASLLLRGHFPRRLFTGA
ncbi:MAG: BatA domain-containing protein, partial [Alphaproteobacteria bacterium]|nr:BatA domain-containing protein [Alphaproteobacteria bacterium]